MHNSRMSRYTQEFIQNRPGGVPGIRGGTPIFKPAFAGGMVRRILIGCINQDVCIDDEHYRPSIAWYRESRSAISTSAPPLRNVGRGDNSSLFFRARNSDRNAVSTSSDIVRPCLAASRFSCAMTVSSMFRVVFIWITISDIWLYVKQRSSQRKRCLELGP